MDKHEQYVMERDDINENIIATLVQTNNKAEAEAIEYYTDFLDNVQNSTLPDEQKSHIKAVIDEIIADELNHQILLQQIYTELTGIIPKKE